MKQSTTAIIICAILLSAGAVAWAVADYSQTDGGNEMGAVNVANHSSGVTSATYTYNAVGRDVLAINVILGNRLSVTVTTQELLNAGMTGANPLQSASFPPGSLIASTFTVSENGSSFTLASKGAFNSTGTTTYNWIKLSYANGYMSRTVDVTVTVLPVPVFDPVMSVHTGDGYQTGVPYVHDGTGWKIAKAVYIHDGTGWKEAVKRQR